MISSQNNWIIYTEKLYNNVPFSEWKASRQNRSVFERPKANKSLFSLFQFFFLSAFLNNSTQTLDVAIFNPKMANRTLQLHLYKGGPSFACRRLSVVSNLYFDKSTPNCEKAHTCQINAHLEPYVLENIRMLLKKQYVFRVA